MGKRGFPGKNSKGKGEILKKRADKSVFDPWRRAFPGGKGLTTLLLGKYI